MRVLMVLLPLLAAACGTARAPAPQVRAPDAAGDLTCVPYARARSGIQLRGDAWQWWDAAEGLYARDAAPALGSVLVLDRTRRMSNGHLAVVAQVVSEREIRVDHANWASGAARGRVARDQPVLDVSPDNDWSQVRVWYPPVGDYGATTYAARGFIYPDAVVASR